MSDPVKTEPYWTALRGGFSFLRGDQVLIGMMTMTFAINVFSQASGAVYAPLWVEEVVGSPVVLGLLFGGFAGGALLGNVIFTVFAERIPPYRAFVIGALIGGAPRLLTMGLSDEVWLVVSVSFLCGIANASLNPVIGVTLYTRVPPELQTRVFGVIGAITFAGIPVGSLLGGWSVALIGLRPALLLAGVLFLLATLIPVIQMYRRPLSIPQYGTGRPHRDRGSKLTEDDDPYCLRPGESAELLAGQPWRRFAVLGDSVAEGLCEPLDGYSDLQWADRLAAELRTAAPELEYLNLGVSGLRAHEIHATQLDAALAFEPDLALVVGGGNDAFSARYDADRVDRELTAMITRAPGRGRRGDHAGHVRRVGQPCDPGVAAPRLAERMRLLSERTRALAERLGTIHVHLTTHPLSTDPGLYSSDGRHGNARSDAVAAAITLRRLGSAIMSRQPEKDKENP